MNVNVSKQYSGKQLNESFNRDINYGIEYDVITTSGGRGKIRLRTSGNNVLQMEETDDNDWKDLVCTVSGGRFIKINGNKCKLIFDAPPKPETQGKSNQSASTSETIFNTIDYITRADRKLWRTNVYNSAGFINEYGVSPFDTLNTLPDNPYAGTHEIVWNNITFPVSGNYVIEIGVDDNVTLKIGDQVEIKKEGFRPGTSISTGKLQEVYYIKQGTYPVFAALEQIPGGQFGYGSSVKGLNPMVLAINIETSYEESLETVPKTWHYNPMGVAMSIEAPLAPIPQQPAPVQEGRCPPNPFWTTRSGGAQNQWHPVVVDGWSTFLNKYAMSPVPPFDD